MKYQLLIREATRRIKDMIQSKLTLMISALHLENAFINFWNKEGNISTLREKILQFPRFNPLILKIDSNNQKFRYFTIPEVDDLYDYSRQNFYGWEDVARQIYSEWCAESQVVIDVGAYSGVYTILAMTNGGPVNIICFEPNPRMLVHLEKNIDLNSNSRVKVLVNRFGLSSIDGEMRFAESEHTSASQIIDDADTPDSSTSNEKYSKVRVAKLDSLRIDGRIDLVKVDIEGHEKDFLLGSFETLTKDKPIILMEALDSIEYAKQKEILETIGYTHVIPIRERNGEVKNYVWVGKEADHFLAKISNIINEYGLSVEKIK